MSAYREQQIKQKISDELQVTSYKGKVSKLQDESCRRRFNAEQIASILHRVLEPES